MGKQTPVDHGGPFRLEWVQNSEYPRRVCEFCSFLSCRPFLLVISTSTPTVEEASLGRLGKPARLWTLLDVRVGGRTRGL